MAGGPPRRLDEARLAPQKSLLDRIEDRDERDLGQVRVAIEGVRALTPLIEQAAPEQAQPIRDALSQLQLAFVRLGGGEGAAPRSPADPVPGAANPAAGSTQPPPPVPDRTAP